MPKKTEYSHVGECLYIHNKSRGYYAIIRVDGKQIKRSLKTKDRQLANAALLDLRRKLLAYDAAPKSITFTALADAWVSSLVADVSTKTKIANGLKKAFDPANNRPVQNIKKDDLLTWRSKRLKDVSGRTVNYELQVLKSIFDYGVNTKKVLLDSPAKDMERVKHETALKNVPSPEQFKLLIEWMRLEPKSATAGGAADVCEFLAYSGIRRGAIPFVTWDCFNFNKGLVKLRNTKLSRWYYAPLYPAMKDFIDRLKAKVPNYKPSDRLFKIDDAKGSLIGACKRAGLPLFGHHSLRHFFATNAVSLGVDFRTVAAWLDHADGGVLAAKVYSHVRPDHSALLAQRMTISADLGDVKRLN